MNSRMINMFEAIKTETYTAYTDFLENTDEDRVNQWFSSVALENSYRFEQVIGLMNELYIREDIDLYPYEEYTRTVSFLSEKYKFAANNFLNLYIQFKTMVFED